MRLQAEQAELLTKESRSIGIVTGGCVNLSRPCRQLSHFSVSTGDRDTFVDKYIPGWNASQHS
jgi:hypothetical protein